MNATRLGALDRSAAARCLAPRRSRPAPPRRARPTTTASRPRAMRDSRANRDGRGRARGAGATVFGSLGWQGHARRMLSSARRQPGLPHRAFSYRLSPMLYPLFRPLLFTLDPETAHDVAFAALDAAAACGAARLTRAARRRVTGRGDGPRFPNRIGLAAGLDKNAAHIDGLATLGFGFIECGTVTPRPQPGNPKPRLFRLPEARGADQSDGFQQRWRRALSGQRRALALRAKSGGILGLNIGRNFDTPNERAIDDYLTCLRAVYAQRELCDGQHFLAEYGRPARAAGRRRAASRCWRRSRPSRRSFRKSTANTRRWWSRSRPISRRRTSAGSRGRWSSNASTASSRPTRRPIAARSAPCRTAAKPAGFPARRCAKNQRLRFARWRRRSTAR